MNWSDYAGAWKRQPLPVGETADLAALRDSFETKRRKMAATLRTRDWAEIVACVVLIAAYAGFWWRTGPSGWPMGIAILLIGGVGVKFGRERWRARRLRLSPDAPLLTKIEADIAELQHQRRMLLDVWSWYLAPCAGAILIHGYVIVARSKPWEPVRSPASVSVVVAATALVVWFAWAINRRAVRKQIEPRLAELEKLRRDAVASSDP
jgi:hypothetical protein